MAVRRVQLLDERRNESRWWEWFRLLAALAAVGAANAAVDDVFSGDADNVFVASRPPGHHAEKATAMGFCLFNNAAVAARHAQISHGAERVAIVDWDVHHGNGTQDIFWDDPSVLYCSTHQMPLYPGTGAKTETGAGNIVNAPLDPDTGSEIFREAFNSRILPSLDAFRPDLIIISAGFDAHRRDPGCGPAPRRFRQPSTRTVGPQAAQTGQTGPQPGRGAGAADAPGSPVRRLHHLAATGARRGRPGTRGSAERARRPFSQAAISRGSRHPRATPGE